MRECLGLSIGSAAVTAYRDVLTCAVQVTYTICRCQYCHVWPLPPLCTSLPTPHSITTRGGGFLFDPQKNLLAGMANCDAHSDPVSRAVRRHRTQAQDCLPRTQELTAAPPTPSAYTGAVQRADAVGYNAQDDGANMTESAGTFDCSSISASHAGGSEAIVRARTARCGIYKVCTFLTASTHAGVPRSSLATLLSCTADVRQCTY
ncbi:hypothetical protein PYCCODRAFT_1200854 [Trametes coccinea BRFM310]|uniref:Uncharacterized protein n=1 Tax=Trametes coccinea (strain BRFM310) TaxID=1353009 RepID=A0A1Y2I795_TRAC3|nr:hypothetical protein PYCCODRAFT_1200854 [Trametes coccinea BRFM310]